MNGNCHYTPQETTVKRSNWAVQDLLVRYIYFMQGMAARGLRDRTNTFSSPEPPLYDILRRVALGTGMGQTQRLNFGLAQMGTFLGAARQFPAQKIKGKHRKQPVSRKMYEKN